MSSVERDVLGGLNSFLRRQSGLSTYLSLSPQSNALRDKKQQTFYDAAEIVLRDARSRGQPEQSRLHHNAAQILRHIAPRSTRTAGVIQPAWGHCTILGQAGSVWFTGESEGFRPRARGMIARRPSGIGCHEAQRHGYARRGLKPALAYAWKSRSAGHGFAGQRPLHH